MDRSTGPGRLLFLLALVCASALPTGCATAARSSPPTGPGSRPAALAPPVAARTELLPVPTDPVRTLATAYGPAAPPAAPPSPQRPPAVVRYPRPLPGSPAAPRRARRRPTRALGTAPGLAALCALAARYPGWPPAARRATGC